MLCRKSSGEDEMLNLARRGRFAVCCWLAFVGFVTCATASGRAAADPRVFEIAAGSAADTLREFGKQARQQTLFNYRLVRDLRTQPVQGLLEPDDALATMLIGTGLAYERIDERTVAIRSSNPDNENAVRARDEAPVQIDRDSGTPEGDQKKSFWDRFRLAHADSGKPAGSAPLAADSATDTSGASTPVRVEEVVVTAQKRLERLQDVPVPVTAVSARELGSSNLLRLQDYSTRIPSLTVTPGIFSQQILSLRGISTGYATNPTVGIAVDDIPYGATTNVGGGNVLPDLDPNELERIEVLRGPQGTLYGANSMGGLLKYVTVSPSVERLSGRLQAGLSGIKNGDEAGYNVRGSINVPLTDTAALRASVFDRRDPGYLEDPIHNEKSVNSARFYGGRLSGLWKISPAVSLQLSALLQDAKGDGASTNGSADPTVRLGELQQDRLPGSGWFDRKGQAYSATITADVGSARLTSLTGYNVNSWSDSFDGGWAYGSSMFPLFGVRGANVYSDSENRRFSQELRADIPFGDRLDWLVGAFYTDEDRDYVQRIVASNPATGADVGTLRTNYGPTTYEEYAGFTDLTFHFSDRFDVQLGGRYSTIRQSLTSSTTGVGAVVFPRIEANDDAFTYLVTPRFKISPEMMIYARVASGYRPGGVNTAVAQGAPSGYDHDTTKNYEVGIKGNIGGVLSYDASLYHIDWQGIQILVVETTPVVRSYTLNGSDAKSEGLELSLEVRPFSETTVSTWVSWGTAELTESFPSTATVAGNEGDRLPNSARVSANLSFDQRFTLSPSWNGAVGAALTYMGERKSVFACRTCGRQTFPEYTKLDLHASLSRDAWEANLFVTNATDRRGVLYGGIGAVPPFAYAFIQPRTYGISLIRTF
jgi:outer membrane receptor protein involved in Fe transport